MTGEPRGTADRPWLVAWAVAGILFALAVSAIGIFTVPVGIVLVLILLRRRGGHEGSGFLAALGTAIAVIGAINLDYKPCLSGPIHEVLQPGQSSVSGSCGGVDGLPWLIVGICVVGAAIAGYLLMRRHRSSE